MKATARHRKSVSSPGTPPLVALHVPVPWGDAERLPQQFDWSLRGYLLTPGTIDRLSLVECTETLPLLAEVEHESGKTLRWWELPATTLEAPPEGGPIKESLNLRMQGSGEEQILHLSLAGLAKPPRDIQLGEGDEQDASTPQDCYAAASWSCYEMIGQHVHVMHEAHGQQSPSDAFQWSRRITHAGLRDLDGVLKLWQNAAQLAEPRYALIVRLAETMGSLITDVCERPRMRLARQRQLQRVGRVQQVDAACLRWLARQPGRTVAEKAGPKQRVMGVIRREEADSLENRVVKDLLRRACRAAVAYLHEHRHFGDDRRLTIVRRFLRLLRRLLVVSPIAEARMLIGIPQPNYVLQHDSRYSKLWTIYLQLIQQERELDDAWRWRQRVWSESMMLAVIAALKDLSTDQSACRSDLMVYSEQVCGRFIHPESQIAPIQVGSWTIDVVVGATQIRQHPLIPVTMAECIPDMMLLVRHGDKQVMTRWLPIWSMVHLGAEETLRPYLATLEARFSGSSNIVPLVLCPAITAEQQPAVSRCATFLFASMPQRSIPVLKQWLQNILS